MSVLRQCALTVVSVAALLAAPTTAQATFPGDNGLIAYAANDGSIWTSDRASGRLTQLIVNGSWPAWSADGRRLAFVRDGAVWVAHADGSSQARLTSGPDDGNPTWSPDGTRIAFEHAGIWLMRADGTQKWRLTDGSQPAWSPDGRRIAYYKSGGVWTVATDGNDARRVASEIQIGTGPSNTWIPEMPDWSPDGRQLAVQYSFDGPCDGCFRLYRVPAAGGAITPVGDILSGAPAWSPDGTQIVAHETDGLRVFDLAGGWQFLRESVSFFDFSFPAWQPLPKAQPEPNPGPPSEPGPQPDRPHDRPGSGSPEVIIVPGKPPVVTSPPSTRRQQRVSRAQAYGMAKAALRRLFGKSFREGKQRRIACRRDSSIRWTCRVSWTYRRSRYNGTVTVRLRASTGYVATVRVSRRRR